MKVLFITNLKSLYGANRSLLDLIDGLKDYEITPFVIVPDHGSFTHNLDKREVEYALLPVPSWVKHTSSSLYQQKHMVEKMLQISKLYQEKIEKWQIELVYTNSSVTPIGRLVSFITKIPHVWHIREFLDLDYNLQFVLPRWLSRFFILTSNQVIYNSKAVRKHYFKLTPKTIHVVYNGIATNHEFKQHNSAKNSFNGDADYVFVMVGYIFPNKGQLKAIKATAKILELGYKVKLLLVGGGDEAYLKVCKDYVEKFGIDEHVRFLGYLKDPFQIYQKFDCLLMCSESEAMGRVTAEAMSFGLPVIGSNSGGTPELISHGESGYLYENEDELVKYMIKLIENPMLGVEMGNRGWRTARERFSIEVYAQNIYKIINSVIN